ncbi:MAG: cation transporter [Cytophagales bacterium]|nr:cation transporter [Cytophaga sp.]
MFSISPLRIQTIIVAIAVLIFSIKISAWYMTQSNAILTDALESIVNIVAGTFSLYSLYLSGKPKDKDHPYGHGKIEFIAATVEGTLIAVAGLGMILKCIIDLEKPYEVTRLDFGLVLICISAVLNYGLGWWMISQGTNQKSIPLTAGGKHLQIDAYTSIGLIAGLVLIRITGYNALDAVIAIVLGILILFSGFKIVRSSVGGIMDETDPSLMNTILEILRTNRKDNWIDLHNLRAIRYGNKYHIDAHITLPWYYTLQQAHGSIQLIETIIETNLNTSTEVFFHMDPCIERSCNICPLKECNVRLHPFIQRKEWTLDNIMMNQKHHLE